MIETGKPDNLEKCCKPGRKSVGFRPDISIIYTYESYGDDCSLKDSDGNSEYQQWTKPRDFFVSLISLTVGLGNIYRFPFALYRNGGGAFLIPYFIMLTFVGRPIYFLELALGQFTSSGQVEVWSLAPILKGVGYGNNAGPALLPK
ncbi:unnamed protein product [Allacma fusca]|uniref:Sodium-dependent nutrient amino acid transporter 1 n=1 Tax=Allacma fusca TaxID=39272 RepID=A0A8J2KUU8_9HEXA|nr:unnamed protein product [Allacma fusca]